MRRTMPLTATFAVGMAVAASAQPPKADKTLARGQYLAERVGMCQDCHTPRNEKAEAITAYLKSLAK